MSRKPEFSRDKDNLEVLNEKKKKPAEQKTHIAPWEKEKDKKPGVNIGTLNVFTTPFRERHAKHYKESTFHLVADTVLGAIILILASILVVTLFWTPKQEIDLEMSHKSKQVFTGQAEEFLIRYDHEGEKTITDTDLTVDLPEDFIFREAIPKTIYDPHSHTFNLGELKSGANGEVKIRGIVMGEPGSRQNISSVFSYLVEGGEGRKIASHGFNIEGSDLSFKASLPDSVYRETDFNSSLQITNNTDLDWEKLLINLKPINWNFSEVYGGGNYTREDQFIEVKNLKRGEKLNLNFTGFTNSDPGNYSWNFEVIGQKDKQEFKLAGNSGNTRVKEPGFKLSLTPEKNSFDLGEKVDFKISFKNQEKIEAREAYFTLQSGDKNFLLKDFNLLGEKYELEGEKIILESLEPNESGELELTTFWNRKNIGTNQVLSLSLETNYRAGGQKVSFLQTSPPVKLLSQLKVDSGGYYYSPQGDQLGVGPLPPQAGVSTGYWIFWEIDNLGNRLTDVVVSAELPEEVVWAEEKTLLAGKFMHGAVSDRVVWEMEEVQAEGGKYKAGFKINLIPEEKDVGQVLDLVQGIEYRAYDSFCDRKISGSLPNITTEIKKDKLSSGKGRVVSR